VNADLYVWAAPREVTAHEAEMMLASWEDQGGEFASGPFEPSSDVGWFYRELTQDLPMLDTASDGERATDRKPTWLSANESVPPARLVTIRLSADTAREDLETVFSLAAKYDLVVFDPRGSRIHVPLEAMAEAASLGFWPRGAIRAFVAGLVGVALVAISWALGIFLLSGVGILIGGFVVIMAVITFVEEGRRWWVRRRAP
jgi:hypothetical protein